ncbi:MAG TPA: arginine--tRNA ligase, partial [Gemmataceae bacterium]|nr:arginine--tRNA ligase [Gemmataceae bacterium]
MNLLHLLENYFHGLLEHWTDDPDPYVAMIKAAQDPRHGDYQANFAMPLAKKLGKNPRELAEEIVDRVHWNQVIAKLDIAGPGFINFHFRTDWLAVQVQEMARGGRLGVPEAAPPLTYVVDYSSPNVAKPLHVGHLRSTIIGDCLARLLRFLGHRVITDNHLGDWGTQFGILLFGYKHYLDSDAFQNDPVRELTRLYIHVRNLMKVREDEETEDHSNAIAEAVRQETAKLHAGDPENVRLWQMFLPWGRQEIDRIYQRLDVHFDYTQGESFYQSLLAEVVRSLVENGIARHGTDGAIIIGSEESPALIRKKDGAFTYTTSDLATICHRVEQFRPDAILYVVGTPQALHFKTLFDSARRWGYDKVDLEHIAFGSVLGPDRRPLKTREGGAVELGQLLDEAVQRGEKVYEQSLADRIALGRPVPPLSPEDRRNIAEVVGIGAVKYADLAQNRTSDYVFNWEKMLATDGNTATYMQYAYVRNRGIFR